MILMILIKISSFIVVSTLPFDFKIHETLEQRRPDLCKCQNIKSTKGRIYGGQNVNPDDLTFAGNIYYKYLLNAFSKSFTKYDYTYEIGGSLSLLNSEW